MTRTERRAFRAELIADVLVTLARSRHVVWSRVDTADAHRILGQLSSGRSFALHCKLPCEEVTAPAREFLIHVQRHHGIGFVVGDVGEVDVWLRGLDTPLDAGNRLKAPRPSPAATGVSYSERP